MDEKHWSGQPLQDLYDSEINFAVATLWDGGFDVKLGDELNGFRAEANVNTWEEVEAWLSWQAIEHYPDSVFALRYRDGLSPDEARSRQQAALGLVNPIVPL